MRPRRKLPALLKLVGTAVLLLSFATQNFAYEVSNARTAELVSAMRDRQLIDKSALLQEVLYFAAINSKQTLEGVDASDLAASKASLAALKVAQSLSVAVNAAKVIPPGEAERVLNSLFARAAQVEDYNGLLDYFSYVEKNFGKHSMQLNVQYDLEKSRRRMARRIYLLTYMLGAGLLLLGLFFDWRGVEG